MSYVLELQGLWVSDNCSCFSLISSHFADRERCRAGVRREEVNSMSYVLELQGLSVGGDCNCFSLISSHFAD